MGEGRRPPHPVRSAYGRGFLLKLGGLAALGGAGGGLALFAGVDRPFDGSYLGALLQIDRLSRDLGSVVLLTVAVQTAVTALLVWVASVFWTHRIAGPLYRLRRTFGRVAEGDLAPMGVLRRRDELKEIPELLNRGLARHEDRLRRSADEARALEAVVRQLRCDLGGGADLPAARVLDALRRVRVLQDALGSDDA